ncbi:MAG: ImmA/IrrE family metallo-endopeptidase [Microbacteriaceae bacterium]|nr:ImmA/IrrE family metallo-endopeptidase [Microbacteriaceae bacterium]
MDPSIVDRIREIVAGTGKTQQEVAAAIGIDGPKLTKSLKGKRNFTSYELAALAELGGKTVDWLLTGEEPLRLAFAHRSSLAAPESLDNAGREYADTILQSWQTASELGFAPQVLDLPRAALVSGYVAQAEQTAERALARIDAPIRTLGLSGLMRVIEEAYSLNLAVVELSDDVDGMSTVEDDLRIIIVGRTDRTGRQRFTIAHELAHVIFDDARGRVIEEQMFRGKSNKESRADVFAAAFLMPRREILDVLAGRRAADAFYELVWEFRVSPVSMAWRLLNLQLISESERVALAAKSASKVAAALDRMEEHLDRVSDSRAERAAGRLTDAFIGAFLEGRIAAAPVSAVSGLPEDAIWRLLEEVDDPDPWS